MIAQVLGGIGAGANSTASMAIMSSFAPNEREKYIGWVEGAAGIGLLTGPLFGAALYNVGGFMMPFFTFAAIYLVAYPYICYILCRAKSV